MKESEIREIIGQYQDKYWLMEAHKDLASALHQKFEEELKGYVKRDSLDEVVAKYMKANDYVPKQALIDARMNPPTNYCNECEDWHNRLAQLKKERGKNG